MNLWKCSCCGSLDSVSLGLDPPPDPGDHVCGLCSRRGRLCLHNMSEHLGQFHYSRVHEGIPSPPETCQYCLEVLLDRELAKRGA
jgi:hypothetical protein